MNFEVGCIIRHLKRGSRYRIIQSFHAIVSETMDGARMDLLLSRNDLADGRGAHLVRHGDDFALDEGDVMIMNVPVMVQVSEKHVGNPVLVFLYTSLDAPGQFFARPASEFVAGRFEVVPAEGPIRERFSRMMPEEVVQLLMDSTGLAVGGHCAGTSLRAFTEEVRKAAGGDDATDIRLVMRRVVAAARDWLGGEEIKIPVLLDAEAADIVILARKFRDTPWDISERTSRILRGE